jgi:DNA polymerase II large subunit
VCGGQLSLTVYRGGMEKYLGVAQHLVKKYRLPSYYAQRISLMEEEIAAMFNSKKHKQISLTDFA